MRVINGIEQLQQLVGQELGIGDWFTVDQERINAFADVTEDHQWIHLDVERARRETPWGTTIAHGFLTLSLLPALTQAIYRVEGVTARINYGLDKVRFLAPVLAGSRIRARVLLTSVEAQGEGRYKAMFATTIELEGSDRPACIAESIALLMC
ncbi:MAG TPA: MaoC family dehydratase [Gammaproteobacteria bacterium]|nr:MaoC family dehydratase [Gammaproteobacteria bacterium]